MKRILLLVSVFSFFISLCAHAQCDIGIIEGTQRHVHDTTYIPVFVDTTLYGTAGYSYHWVFADGSTHTGSSAVYAVTTAGNFDECHCYVTGPGCTSDQIFYLTANVVFNCNQLSSSMWDDFNGTPRQTGPNANDVAVAVMAPAFGDSIFKMNLSLDWGNGHNIFVSRPADYLWGIGGVGDTINASHYAYAGQYTLHASYYYSYDTLTCPVRSLDSITIHAGGLPSVPELYGATTYCAGDTVRLNARDTTQQFHNLYHHPAVAGNVDYWPSNYDLTNSSGYETNSSIYFQWYDKNYNLLWQDTTLVSPNVRVQDSGMYILRVIDGITGRDTQAVIHIAVTGSRLTLDSVAVPTCTTTGAFYFNCHRANDSVTISYLKDGIQQTYAGRTNPTGHIRIAGLTEGEYTEVQARFAGDICGSNIIAGPFSFHSLPSPVTTSYLRTCAGGSLTLTATSPVSGVSYLWQGPGGFTSTQQNPVITTGTTATLQQYSVSITSGICNPSDISVTNVVVSATLPNVSGAHFTDSICVNASFALTGMGNDYGYTSSSITSSDTTVVNGMKALKRGSSALTYTVSNMCGSSSFTQTVHVKPGPVLPNITGPASMCAGSMVTYNIATTGGTWSTVGTTMPNDVITNHSFGFKAGSSSVTNPLIYTKDSGGCRSVATVSYAMADTIRNIYLPPVGLYPGDTITPIVRLYTSSNPLYSGTTILPGLWTPVSSPVATVNSAGLISGGSHTGSILLNIGVTNLCGSGTDSSEAYVSDWIDSRIADGPVQDMVRDKEGNLYVLSGNRIRKIDSNRNESYIAGAAIADNWQGDYTTRGYSGDGGNAMEADLSDAKNIARDNVGNIYLSYPGEGVIRKIDTSGIITRYAGILGNTDFWPSYGYSGDGGPATAAHITASYMVTDNAGNLYFSEFKNHRVRKVDAAGIITTFAGDGTIGFTGDGGVATSAKVGWPMGLAIDTSGNILVSTMGRIRKIDPSGNITTIAGIDSGYMSTGHQATATQPMFAGSIACDKLGNIFCVSISWNKNGWYYPYYPYYYYYVGYGNYGLYNGYYNSTKRIDKDGVVSLLGANQQPYQVVTDAAPSVHTSAYHAICVDDSGGVYIAGFGQTIRHSGKPTLEILASQDAICHGPASITFTARGHYTGSSASYQWQKNGIPVGTDSFVYTDPAFAAGDSISCKVYLSAGGYYLASAKRTVAIDQNPPVISAIAGMHTVCVADSITLTDTAHGGVWSSSNSAVTVVNGNVIGMAAGSSIITYTLTNACGITSDTISVTVNPLPDAGMITGAAAVCEGSSITLVNSVVGGTWSSSAANATVTGGVVTGVTAGATIVTYTSTNTCGTAQDTMQITVLGLPTAGSIAGDNMLCIGAVLTLSNTVAGGSWSSSSSAVTVANGVVAGLTAGSAIISYSVSNYCGTATDTLEVRVNSLPVSGTISGADSVCEGVVSTLTASVTGGIWSSSATAQGTISSDGVFMAVHEGDAVIAYSVTNICGTAVSYKTIHVNALTDCNGVVSGFNIYPDPNNGSFTVEIPQPGDNAVITIQDVTGRIIQTITPSTGAMLVPVALANMPTGIYMVKLVAAGKVYSGKVVIR